MLAANYPIAACDLIAAHGVRGRSFNQMRSGGYLLWRFWPVLPGWGGMAVFDRSWYGRVIVERVEGFATREQWLRAPRSRSDRSSETATA